MLDYSLVFFILAGITGLTGFVFEGDGNSLTEISRLLCVLFLTISLVSFIVHHLYKLKR